MSYSDAEILHVILICDTILSWSLKKIIPLNNPLNPSESFQILNTYYDLWWCRSRSQDSAKGLSVWNLSRHWLPLYGDILSARGTQSDRSQATATLIYLAGPRNRLWPLIKRKLGIGSSCSPTCHYFMSPNSWQWQWCWLNCRWTAF